MSLGDAGTPIVLTANTILSGNTAGAITLGGTVNGAYSLTVNTTGTTTLSGDIGGNTALTTLTTNTGGTTVISVDIETSSTQTYNDAVTINGTLDFTGSTVQFANTLAGDDGTGDNLTISGALDLDGAATSLTSLTVEGTSNLGADVTTSGTQTYTSGVTVSGGDRILTGTIINFGSTLAGGTNALTITGNVDLDGAATNLSTLSVSGTSNLGANVTTSSTQTYSGDATISNDITLTTTNSNVSFGGTLDSSGTSSSTTASIVLTDIDTGNTETITGTAGQTTNHVPTRNDVYDRATLSAYSTAILYDGMELYGEITTIDNSSGSSSTTVDFTDGQLSSLTLSGEIVNSSDASTLTIAAGSGDVTFTDAVGGSTAMGNITITTGALSAAAIKVQGTIDITNTDTSSITGIISDGASSAIVTKAGSGTLLLSANNTYTGQTNINAGIISITDNNSLGSADGATIVADGASLSISNDITSAENITISGTGISSNGAIRNTADDNTLTGLITLGANSEIQIDTGSSLTLNPTTGSAVTGTYNLTIDSVGTSVPSVIRLPSQLVT